MRIALPVLVNPQGSPLDAFFPAEAHDYLGHVTFTGTIGELVQFMQVIAGSGAPFLRSKTLPISCGPAGCFDAIRRTGANPIVVGEGLGPLPGLSELTRRRSSSFWACPAPGPQTLNRF